MTVDDIAKTLLEDMLRQHITTLLKMPEKQISDLCDEIRPCLEQEFNIWENQNFLDSCSKMNEGTTDPVMIVLKRMMWHLKNGVHLKV